MVLFSIPDIRLFWSTDPRFLSQFSQGKITTFKPYSKYPECYKDMSFWLPPTAKEGSAQGGKGKVWHENDFCELVREVAGDLVESVRLVSRCVVFAGLYYHGDIQPEEVPRSWRE